MENSEIPEPVFESQDGVRKDTEVVDLNGSQQKTENSRTKNKEDATRKKRTNSAKKQGGKEVGPPVKRRVSRQGASLQCAYIVALSPHFLEYV